MIRLFAAVLAAALCLSVPTFAEDPEQAKRFETKAQQAFMIEAETGAILYAKNADELVPPASLAKMMTMELVFHQLKQGELSLDQTFKVSENAWRTGGAPSGGSTMFAKINSVISLGDLIQAVIVQSANDGCIVIAEGLAGSEAAFAEQMTERARALGLDKSTFKNTTGLPAEGQVVTMRELALLGLHIWREYPDFYDYYSQPEFTWNEILQRNRNPLLRMEIGADGMKTGYTEESGYAIVGSAQQGDTRLFVAMSGMASAEERAAEAKKILEWGFSAFERVELFAEGEMVGEAQVYGGADPALALKAKGPVAIYLPTEDRDNVTARVVYQGPIRAPVDEGAQVASLQVWMGDRLAQETPLFAAESIAKGKLSDRALDAVAELLIGWMR